MFITAPSPLSPRLEFWMLPINLVKALSQKTAKVTIPVISILNLSLRNIKIRLVVRIAMIAISLHKVAVKNH